MSSLPTSLQSSLQSSLQFSKQFDLAARSCAGAAPHARAENQDNYLLIDAAGHAEWLHHQAPCRRHLAHWPRGHARLAVLDGMGGHGQGRQAAEAAVAGVLAMPPCTTLAALEHYLDALHARLQQAFAGSAGRRPGTTLTVLELAPGRDALLYHVGDSRLYLLEGASIAPLTVDHVPATALALAGALDADQWWQQVHGEHRPQIAQAFMLGNAFADPARLDDALYPLDARRLPPWLAHLADRRAIALRPGASYLLATDGFWSCPDALAWTARWPALAAGGADSAAVLAALFDAITLNPPPGLHPDNLTAAVLRMATAPQHGLDDTALPTHRLDADNAR